MKRKLLIVDDETGVTAALRRALQDELYDITIAHGGEEGLRAFAGDPPQVVLTDERMPGMDGTEFLTRVRRDYPETVRLMLTGQASMEDMMRAVNEGEIYRFFTKPWKDLELKMALRSAFEKYELESENRRLLAVVKRQSDDLAMLERKYPGITAVEKDADGYLILSDPDEESS